MVHIKHLERQHKDVRTLMHTIQVHIQKNTVTDNAQIIAKSINILAGKLKIHLQEEDRSLYPKLKDPSNPALHKMGQNYDKEMKQIFPLFVVFKNQYNTRSKIEADPQSFVIDAKNIFNKLENRLNKEDYELYPLLK